MYSRTSFDKKRKVSRHFWTMTLIWTLFLGMALIISQQANASDDDTISELMAQLRNFADGQVTLVGVSCYQRLPASETADGQKALAIQYRSKGKRTYEGIELRMKSGSITSAKEFAIDPQSRLSIDGLTYKSFKPEPHEFRVDAKGYAPRYDLVMSGTDNRKITAVERLAPMLHSCCRKGACRRALSRKISK